MREGWWIRAARWATGGKEEEGRREEEDEEKEDKTMAMGTNRSVWHTMKVNMEFKTGEGREEERN